MRQIKAWTIMILMLSSVCFVSCNKEETISPITLVDGEQNIVGKGDSNTMSILIRWRELLFQIQGGDGKFVISNDNEDVLDAKCDGRTVTLIPLVLGKANITIKDSSGNTLFISVNVKVDKSSATIISSPSCRIYGENISDQDRMNLEKELLSSTFKEGGGYYFIYEKKNAVEKVRIYPQKLYDVEYKEYDSMYKGEIPESLAPSPIHEQIYYWYIFTSNEEELALFCIRDEMRAKKESNNIRMNLPINYVYLLDVTSQYKVKYPNLERVYIEQALKFQDID